MINQLYDLYLNAKAVKTDTRTLENGDIYFALKGPNFNGNQFTQQAFDKGASYAVVDEKESAINEKCLLVDDVLNTLQQLAIHHRKQFSIPFIAITGSNGKTTTKELLHAVLQKRFKTCATKGNLNNHIGVPLTLLRIKNDAEIAIIEMGANHQKEIEGYCKIAQPTHGVITNCGKAHIEGFGGEEGVRKGKGELFEFIRKNYGVIFRNTDLSYLEEMANGIDKQITYGSSNAHYIGKPLTTGMLLNVAVLTTGAETTIHTNLVGTYNFPNVMLAVAAGLYFGISVDEIRSAIEDYIPDNSRSQFIEIGNNKIILDAYNANPTSMRAAINNFAQTVLPDKILWLGGMKEMGEQEKFEHTELVAFIRKYSWKDVLLVGKEFENLHENYKWFENAKDACDFVQSNKPANASILIKGSRSSKMELLLDVLKN